jgi:hypothetical protein
MPTVMNTHSIPKVDMTCQNWEKLDIHGVSAIPKKINPVIAKPMLRIWPKIMAHPGELLFSFFDSSWMLPEKSPAENPKRPPNTNNVIYISNLLRFSKCC